jgi:fused signal recognition particle receptor
MGLFDKLKAGLQKTTRLLNTDIRDLFKSEGRLVDDDFLDDLLSALIKTDMGVQASQQIIDRVHSDFRGRVVHLGDVLATVKQQLKALLAQPEEPIRLAAEGPTVIMVAGVNGAGKTTSIAKLAQMFRSQGKQVVLGAADTFRAAAVEQLTIWAGRLGAEIVKGEQGSDPASIAHRAVARALELRAEVCIIDTAGRLQTQQNLMQELSKIHRVIGKQIPAAPHEVLLVLDATTGQNGISQAKHFT